MIALEGHKPAAAEHGVVADAACGEQDRGDFESWIQPDGFPDLQVRRG